MIWIVALLWMVSLVSLLKPFVTQKIGFETFDALDVFKTRQGALLCLLMFAFYPGAITATISVISVLLRINLRNSLILVCFSVLWIQFQPSLSSISILQ